MKKIIIPILIIFLTFIIYKVNDDNLVDYMSLGDSIDLGINSYGNKSYGYNNYIKTYLENNNQLHKSNFFYSKNNYSLEELFNDINMDKKILYNDTTYNIKKELREADLITIAIGMDNLVNILSDNNIENFNEIKNNLDFMKVNMDKLIKKVTSITKGKVVLLGYYNPFNMYNKDIDRIFAYLDDSYLDISKKYKIVYIPIYDLIKQNKEYMPNKNDYHLTSKAYLKIANEIVKKIENEF